MENHKALHSFTTVLDNDFKIGSNHLIDDLHEIFTAPDFLYFFALRDYFWADVEDEDEQMMISASMTECYLSALLHISSGEYHFDEFDHHLEYCILYGDLLSGAFSERLISMNRMQMLEEWLNLLQRINKELLSYSLEGVSTEEKKACLVSRFVEALAKKEDASEFVEMAKKILLENVMPESDHLFFNQLKSRLKGVIGKQLSSAKDLKILCERVNP